MRLSMSRRLPHLEVLIARELRLARVQGPEFFSPQQDRARHLQNVQCPGSHTCRRSARDSSRQIVNRRGHRSLGEKTLIDMPLELRACSATLAGGGLVPKNAQLQCVGYFKFDKRSQEKHGTEKNLFSRSRRVRVRVIKRNQKTGVGKDVQRSPLCIAISSAPLTFDFLLP